MKTSKKTDYAVHALIILARNEAKEISVNEIAEIEKVSPSYLAKVMQALSRNGLVSSSEGKEGGYQLNKRASEINLADIMEVFEEKENIFDCVDQVHGCTIRDRCKIHRAFTEAYQNMLEELRKTTIEDLMDPEIKFNQNSK